MKKRKNTVKKSLLISMAAVALSCAMLVGSTYAWFTDNATSGTNNIVAGNLDIELQHKPDGSDDFIILGDNDTIFPDMEKEDFLWEPGQMVVSEPFKLANVGNLALQYSLALDAINETVVNDHMLSEVIRMIVVDENTYTEALGTPTEDSDNATVNRLELWRKLTDTTQGGQEPGNITKYVEKGIILPNESEFEVDGAFEGETKAQVIVLYWQENGELDNDFNIRDSEETLSIELGLKVTATQTPAESDSFGPNYDADIIPAATAAEFENAFDEITTDEPVSVVLGGDIDLTESNGGDGIELPNGVDVDITVEGNGATIDVGHTAFNSRDNNNLEGVKKGKLVFHDVTFKGSSEDTNGQFAIVLGFDSDVEVVFENCKFENLYEAAYGNTSNTPHKSTITFNNCMFTNVNYGVGIYSEQETYDVTFNECTGLDGKKYEAFTQYPWTQTANNE